MVNFVGDRIILEDMQHTPCLTISKMVTLVSRRIDSVATRMFIEQIETAPDTNEFFGNFFEVPRTAKQTNCVITRDDFNNVVKITVDLFYELHVNTANRVQAEVLYEQDVLKRFQGWLIEGMRDC